jgi:HAD superfamily hydrolase (TIGR01549 family)
VVKAVIFDIDGTLVDSVDLHARAWQEAFAHFGKQFAFEKVRYQIGKGGDQLLPVFLSEREIEEFGDELTEYRGELFKREYLLRVVAFPRVRELFERVLRDGKRVALASSAKKDELKEYKRIADIEDLVEEEASADDAEKSKPHPDIFEAALSQLGDVEPSDAIVVGDTPYDAEAARKAGLRTIGLLSGGFPEEDLRAAGCVRIYKDAADLLANYDTSPLASEQRAPRARLSNLNKTSIESVSDFPLDENPTGQLRARVRRRRETSRRPLALARRTRPRSLRRHRARLAAARASARRAPAKQRLRTLSLRNLRDARGALKLARFARANRIDIIHAHVARDYTPACFAARISARSAARLVITRHVLFPLSRFNRFALERLARHSRLRRGRARASCAKVFDPEKIRVVTNGVDLRRFEEARAAFEREEAERGTTQAVSRRHRRRVERGQESGGLRARRRAARRRVRGLGRVPHRRRRGGALRRLPRAAGKSHRASFD